MLIFVLVLGWEFITENKKVRKQENKKTRTWPRKRQENKKKERKLALDQECDQEKKKKKYSFLDHFLGLVLVFFLCLLFSCFLTFLFSFINSHLWTSTKDGCPLAKSCVYCVRSLHPHPLLQSWSLFWRSFYSSKQLTTMYIVQ